MTELPVVEQPPQHSAALLDYLARRMRSAGVEVLDPLGLRPRHLIALTVLRDHGASSQVHLAEVLDIDRTNLVGLLNDLEEAGLVERRRSAQDRRRHDVVITVDGRQRLAQAEMRLRAIEDMVLGALTGSERETLHALLSRAAQGLASRCTEATGCADDASAC
jgi:MarR family transcriptional regulator, lower aerobic nicotinate degradation pathway regulator